jgi:hypothetical protein
MCQNFDIDAEYMLTDLILHTKMLHFDTTNFITSCTEYLDNDHSSDDLACWESVLYVLLKQNKQLRVPQIKQICTRLEQKLKEFNNDANAVHLLNLSAYIKNLV